MCFLIFDIQQHFLETLDPFPGQSVNDIQNYLYEESLRIEPRGCKAPLKFVSFDAPIFHCANL
jgi:son of sevenless